MAVPKLALDRPFTYLLDEELGAGTGNLVAVPFHGRTVNGWVLGRGTEMPAGKLLRVRSVRSPVRFFDAAMLSLLRWVSHRYIAALATVIERSHPPRVAGEEDATSAPVAGPVTVPSLRAVAEPVEPFLLEPGVSTWQRPLPGEEGASCTAAVRACLELGRGAIVLVPEADPVPWTASAVLEEFADRSVAFLGGEPRTRYRTWLEILAGRYDVVVTTRPGVFAPVPNLGLIWVSREVHPGHREDRAPYYHVGEVAVARARIHRAACVLSSFAPSVDTVAQIHDGSVRESRPDRTTERANAPLVETTPPEGEDRSARLGALLKSVRSAALIVSRRGYGVARVCRTCGEPAACAACRGPIVVRRGIPRCGVCAAPGRCANCGSEAFGVERGGTERVAEWAARASGVPVRLSADAGPPAAPGPGTVLVGTASAVKDVGPVRLDLVAILDPDRALRRAGVHAAEQALATWMEAAAWSGPRSGGGRVLVQTRRAGHPAIQALVRWDPLPYLRSEAVRRTEAGFAPGHGVYRISGSSNLPDLLRAAGAVTVLSTTAERGTLCLVAVPPERLEGFRREVLRLAADGSVDRVEAEPQL